MANWLINSANDVFHFEILRHDMSAGPGNLCLDGC